MNTCLYCGRLITRRMALLRNVLFFGGIARYDKKVAPYLPYCCSVDCARKKAAVRRMRVRPWKVAR